ncbi:MAG: hypothetical protein NC930_07470 [Candidatus Omnitrophica bacterium]|nr:hypothetical protein [Candidatus Omnitrophota bacterium]
MTRGKGTPSTRIKLAKVLGVSLDEYLGFATLEPDASGEPELIKSDVSITVEQLALVPGSELDVKRVQIIPHQECILTRYLDREAPRGKPRGGKARVSKKPAFF